MLANSEFVALLKQANTDLYKLYNTNIHEKIAEQKKRLEQQ
jgi:hypothetical protein